MGRLTAKASVPHKIRKNLTAAAQFLENFKHRRTVKTAMTEAFRSSVAPTALHRLLADVPELPLVVHAWYDDLPQKALSSRNSWGVVQGVSQAEHFGEWVHYFSAGGAQVGRVRGLGHAALSAARIGIAGRELPGFGLRLC